MRISQISDQTQLREFMNRDAGETAYALGDLDPANWSQSHFWGAVDHQNDLHGFVLFYHGFSIPTLTMHGSVEAAAAILDQVDLPPEVFCLAPERFHDVIRQHYEMRHIYPLWRMLVTAETFVDTAFTLLPDQTLVRLTPDDAERLNRFYRQAASPEEEVLAFSPAQIGSGVFYTVETLGYILAAAGTHIASTQENIAAVGNVFTAPDQRGKGYGSITTAAVTRTLFEMGIDRVVLNVKAKNTPAIHVYQKLGYNYHCMMIEGPAPLK